MGRTARPWQAVCRGACRHGFAKEQQREVGLGYLWAARASAGGRSLTSPGRQGLLGLRRSVSPARGPGGSAQHLSPMRVSLPSMARCCASVSQSPGGEDVRHVELSAMRGK